MERLWRDEGVLTAEGGMSPEHGSPTPWPSRVYGIYIRKTAELGHNSHTRKPTLLKSTTQSVGFWYIRGLMQLLPLSLSRTFSSSHSPLPPDPATTNPLGLQGFASWTLYVNTLRGPLGLALVIWQNVFQVHPHCGCPIPLHG